LPKETILCVEDDPDIRELVRYNLSHDGYSVLEADTGEKGLQLLQEEEPDIVLLDLMLPGIDGLEVCKRMRTAPATSNVPIVMVTAKGEEADIVTGLEIGADDYITKPFSPTILRARVRALLRRRNGDIASHDKTLRIQDLAIDPTRFEARVEDKVLDLTKTEFGVLLYLAKHPGWVRTRYQIVDAVHGEQYPVTERSVDVQIVGLRRKLGKAGNLIETVRGVGYRFKEH
jgi:two-component system phosphate regulon response regulator PhoB